MRKGLSFIFIMLFACINSIQANSHERLFLKNGTILEGHIQKQVLGESITFRIDKADITVDSRWLSKQTEEEVDTTDIDIIWRKWFQENKDLKSSSSTVTMTNLQFADEGTIKRYVEKNEDDSLKMMFVSRLYGRNDDVLVQVLERGSNVRFVDVSPRVCTFGISEIRSISYSEQDPLAINGIVDVIETNSGEKYRGTIIENILGKSYRMKTLKGVVQNIPVGNISCVKKERMNSHVSIIKQTPYLDVIDGTEGIITLQYFGKDQSEDYILMTDTNDKERKFLSNDVKEIERITNDNYEPLKDVVISNHETYFNRTIVYPLSLKKDKQGRYTLDKKQSDEIKTIAVDATRKELIVSMENKGDEEAIMLFPITQKKVGRDHVYTFTAEEMIKFIPYKYKQVSAANNLQLIYKLGKGTYAFYKNNEFYFFKIK